MLRFIFDKVNYFYIFIIFLYGDLQTTFFKTYLYFLILAPSFSLLATVLSVFSYEGWLSIKNKNH